MFRNFINILFILSHLNLFSQSSAQKLTREQYIETYKKIAIKEQKRTGIPASITLAQGILESDNGNSILATEANNHFGIKCHSGWTGDSLIRDDDYKNECFRKYSSASESYKDHSDFLMTRQRTDLLNMMLKVSY
ncbi:MAG: glucosaminidase domain-containing protein [Bacteroidia bacterium]|nr:glucosaminidase domain-containing protein [Bacteroidia bacterium]